MQNITAQEPGKPGENNEKFSENDIDIIVYRMLGRISSLLVRI
ncbi:hypothetical protein ACFL1M_03915 [Patescibacteria group bacterium]